MFIVTDYAALNFSSLLYQDESIDSLGNLMVRKAGEGIVGLLALRAI